MGEGGIKTIHESGCKKTPFQLEALNRIYSGEKYPKRDELEASAAFLGLTYKQVVTWFKEKRKKDRKLLGEHLIDCLDRQPTVRCVGRECNGSGCSSSGRLSDDIYVSGCMRKKRFIQCQALLPKNYILRKIFRKDGPPLGLEFDPPPNNALSCLSDVGIACADQRSLKKRKIMQAAQVSKIMDANSAPARKHGMGKRLMTVMHLSNLHTAGTQIAFPASESHVRRSSFDSDGSFEDNVEQNIAAASGINVMSWKKRTVACSLSSVGNEIVEQCNEVQTLVDDEELELSELQVGPNPLKCSAHISGSRGCPLCKDLLGRFPPPSVTMKQPFSTKPWDSSSELVKMLFKVMRFLYAQYSVLGIQAFTLDEFAQTFHEKDSLLLGEIHVCLLKQLFKDAVNRTVDGFVPRSSQECAFVRFMSFVSEQGCDVNVWNRSLNSLTWVEILRQVLIAAGFGSKQNKIQKYFDKEIDRMVKYGLRPRTLKGELFALLSNKGAAGAKVAELAKSSKIVELGLQGASELEELIHKTLSSDITLFEKIAPTAFRLRVDPRIKGKDDDQSDTDDSGSVDDDDDRVDAGSHYNSLRSNNLEEIDLCEHKRMLLGNIYAKEVHHKQSRCVEIDESCSGKAWVLGLMEGEYSNLSIAEKLDMLHALVNLVSSAKSNMRSEVVIETTPTVLLRRSGGKIKKIFRDSDKPLDEALGPTNHVDIMPSQGKSYNVRAESNSNYGGSREVYKEWAHSPQAVLLGSDRRYNNYWLFLGPCTIDDPGHRRVYFESSEDGHWEVIDSPQALLSLLHVLDSRGIREAHLLSSMKARQESLIDSMINCADERFLNVSHSETSGDRSSPVSDVDNTVNLSGSAESAASGAIVVEELRHSNEKKLRWQKSQKYDKWIWNSFYMVLNAVRCNRKSFTETLRHCESCHDLYWRDEKHCRICHSTFEVDFDLEERYTVHVATCREAEDIDGYPKHKVLPSHLQTLKASIHAIEATLPVEALTSSWKKSAHKLWVKRLRRTSSLPELFQVLVDLVGAINEDWHYECSSTINLGSHPDDIITNFQTLPQTTSALALWIVKLDALIAPHVRRAGASAALTLQETTHTRKQSSAR